MKFNKEQIKYFTEYYDKISEFEILDDNCYKNGEEVKFNILDHYIIVVGSVGIGKSQYSKIMSKFNRDIQYYSEQSLDIIHKAIRDKAIKIIIISEVIL